MMARSLCLHDSLITRPNARNRLHIMTHTPEVPELQPPVTATFPPGSSELARLIRQFDWSSTAVGPMVQWPQSLRTVTGLLLLSPVPMVLLWGEAGVMIYNDAYSTLAGSRHPQLLGSEVRKGWAEIAGFNDHVMKVCLAGGTLAYKDQELTLHRNGEPEQVWMNLGYSPVLDESGKPGGVIALAVETTSRVLAEQQIKAEQLRLSRLFEQAPGLMVMLSGPDHVFEMANPAYLKLMGYRDVLGKPLREAIPEVEGQGFIALLDQVYRSGEAFVGTGVEIHLEPVPGQPVEPRYFDFVYQPVVDAHGKVTGIFADGYDVTERVLAVEEVRLNESRLEFLDELGNSLSSINDAETVLATITRLLGEHLNASVCAYADMDPDGRMFTIRGNWHAPTAHGIVGRYDLEAFGQEALRLLGNGKPLVLTDTAGQLPAHEAATFLKLGLAATICIPLVKNGALAALMAVHDSSARQWTSSEIRLVTDVTERSWAYVERVRLDAQARTAEQRFRQQLEAEVAERTAKLAESQAYIRTIFDTSHLYQGLLSAEGIVLYANETALQGVQATAEEVIGKPFWDTPWFTGTPGISAKVKQAVVDMRTETVEGMTLVLQLPSGVRSFDFSLRPVLNEAGELVAIVPEGVENTARLRAEQAMRQAQKMEALGNLTGGIAHDFNNLLMAVLGNLELLRKRLPEDPQLLRLLDNARQGAQRGAALTSRMLTFARKQDIKLARVHIPQLIGGMRDLLESSLGPTITIGIDLATPLADVQTDGNLLESAILNLAVNARDALKGSGHVHISASVQDLTVNHSGLAPGLYVGLCVADNGEGMDEATLQRATEPFFTTKDVGSGTGLGLSMIHGLAQHSGGGLVLESQRGNGTTATIWLPALASEQAQAPVEKTAGTPPPQMPMLKILAVDDDELVLQSTVAMLAEQGHRVTSATSARQALQLLEKERFDVLVTDHAMPHMTGTQLAAAAWQQHPELPAVLVTGYSELAPQADARLLCLAKPFSQAALLKTIAKAVGSVPC